jgi:hypothetical protein
MGLEDAISAVEALHRQYRNSTIDREVAAKLIGFNTLSGPAAKALAALASYGLIERAGKGEIRVTERSRTILYSDDVNERRDNLIAAAQEPPLFRQLRAKFPEMLVPPRDGVITFLRRQNFNETAIKPATRAFLGTMKYLEQSGVTESYGSQSSSESESSSSTRQPTRYGGAKVGDWVQWESQGVLQFTTPQRVRHVSEDGDWVAVEGSETGLPMNEVIVQKPAPEAVQEPRSKAPTFPLQHDSAEGEEWIKSRLGPEVQVQLFVKDDMGPKEISKLIRLLEAQKAVLEDE